MDTQTRHALKQDSFIEATTSGLGWIADNRSIVIKGGVALVVVVAAALAAVITYNNREARAEDAFGAAMSIYSTPLQQPGQPAEPGEKTYATAADRARAAHPLFEQVANAYGWFRVGANARYFAGLTDLDMGQTSTAESELKQAADSHDSSLAALAKMALAGIYHQAGRDSEAAALYQGLIKHPTVTVPQYAAKLELAEMYENSNPAEAKRLYAEIKDQDKTTAAGQIAAQKLQTLK